MQTARLLQTVVLLCIIALSASCAASKEYTAKVFGPRTEPVADSVKAVRFLELEKINEQEDGWVSTDIIKKDSAVTSTEPVVIAKQKPVVTKDSTVIESEPVAKTTNANGTRNKTSRE